MKTAQTITIQVLSFDTPTDLEQEDRELLDAALKASHNAYAPYSQFYVGAALLLENGKVLTGNNQENAAYPSGLCAERVAIYSAHAAHPGVKIKKMAVSARSEQTKINTPVPPCGACRQAIAEYEMLFASPIQLIMGGETGKILKVNSIEDLLPLMFSAKDLNK